MGRPELPNRLESLPLIRLWPDTTVFLLWIIGIPITLLCLLHYLNLLY